MKKIYFFISLFTTCIINAQFGCDQSIQISDGYSETGITTPGTGSAPGTWVTSAEVCDPYPGNNFRLPYTTVGDDYLFSYTSGDVAGETVEFTITTRAQFHGLLAFKGCNGTVLTQCVQNHYSPNSNTTKVARIENLGINETVYFIVGIWSLPNNLNFDVDSFVVTLPDMSKGSYKIKEPVVYPNPASNLVNVSFSENINSISITNQLGQTISKINVDKSETSIDIESLPKGNYTLLINTNTGTFYKKLLK
jgi:hypothetical protein